MYSRSEGEGSCKKNSSVPFLLKRQPLKNINMRNTSSAYNRPSSRVQNDCSSVAQPFYSSGISIKANLTEKKHESTCIKNNSLTLEKETVPAITSTVLKASPKKGESIQQNKIAESFENLNSSCSFSINSNTKQSQFSTAKYHSYVSEFKFGENHISSITSEKNKVMQENEQNYHKNNLHIQHENHKLTCRSENMTEDYMNYQNMESIEFYNSNNLNLNGVKYYSEMKIVYDYNHKSSTSALSNLPGTTDSSNLSEQFKETVDSWFVESLQEIFKSANSEASSRIYNRPLTGTSESSAVSSGSQHTSKVNHDILNKNVNVTAIQKHTSTVISSTAENASYGQKLSVSSVASQKRQRLNENDLQNSHIKNKKLKFTHLPENLNKSKDSVHPNKTELVQKDVTIANSPMSSSSVNQQDELRSLKTSVSDHSEQNCIPVKKSFGKTSSNDSHVPSTSDSNNLISCITSPPVPSSAINSLKSFKKVCLTIKPQDVLYSLLEYKTIWLQNQAETDCCPEIFRGLDAVKDRYTNFNEYSRINFQLQLMKLWLKLYESWKKQPFKFSARFDSCEEHSFYFKNKCCATVTENNMLVNQDVILITSTTVGGESQCLFGFAFNIMISDHSHKTGPQGEKSIIFTFRTAEKLRVKTRSSIQIQKLCNIRVALREFFYLEAMHSCVKEIILNPWEHVQDIEVIEVPSCSSVQLEPFVHEITAMDSRFILVTYKSDSDSFGTLLSLVFGFMTGSSTVLVCLRDSKRCIKLAEKIKKSDFVLALKEDEVRDIPDHLRKFTLRAKALDLCNIDLEDAELNVLANSKVVLTVMSSAYLSHTRNAILGSNLVCLIDEAHMCTESETLLPLSYDLQSMVLLGDPKKNLDLHPDLQYYNCQKSLFLRLLSVKV